MLGLRFCARAFSSCGKRGPLFIAVRGPLTIAASLVTEHRLQTRRLSSCGSRAQLLRGMWDLPRPGLEPVSPALAGRFPTTAPPGKPRYWLFKKNYFYFIFCWSVVDLQCCVSFRCTAKWLRIYIYSEYIYSFSDSFPLSVIFKLSPLHAGHWTQGWNTYLIQQLCVDECRWPEGLYKETEVLGG